MTSLTFQNKYVNTHNKFDPISLAVVFHWNASLWSSNLTDGNDSSSGVRPNLIRSNADSLLVKTESLSHPDCNNVNSSRDISCILGPEMTKNQVKMYYYLCHTDAKNR